METKDFYVPLQRKNGMPLHVQIGRAIRDRLLKQAPAEEVLLPPQRDLAKQLGVSRNTVAIAYAELERQGLVLSRVGKGTLVVDSANKMEGRTRREAVLKVIERSAEEALALGLTLDEYANAVRGYLREKSKMLRHIRLVFVECNREQLAYFAGHLRLEAGVTISPLLLSEVREHPRAALERLKSADAVVTSFYHVEELDRVLKGTGARLVGITLQPEMSTIVKIARIPQDARVGLVATSSQFLVEICKTLREIGIASDRVDQSTATEGKELGSFVAGVDALIVSPSRKKEVENLADGKPVVEFLFAPDDTSVKHIRVVLVELKRQREAEK